MLKIAVLLFDGVEELDFAGPFEVLSNVGETFTVAASREVRGRHGLKVVADYTFETAPQPDVLVVPGGPITRENPDSLADAVKYARKVAPDARLLLSVCTGAFILAMAGLLDGRSCTTHYRRRHLLAARFPQVHLRYARVVSDGKIVTTAGVAAGIDGSLFAVSRLFGQEQALKIARQIEYPWHSTHTLQASSLTEPHEITDEATARAWS
jgi:transcriptional regulator GlxA family with amidase domain